MQTKRKANGTLYVPVLDADTGNELPEVVLRGTLLGQMFTQKQLQSLAIVKVNLRGDEAPVEKAELLNNLRFPDGERRTLVFNSSDNYFFCDPEVASELGQFFATNPESACTHGSLLTSDCFEEMRTVKKLKVRIVDFEQMQAEGKTSITNDCFGWCSPRIARTMGGQGKPFQFRLGYIQSGTSSRSRQPGTSFIAKGVLRPSTIIKDYDILLDRSSIKGIAKDKLDELLPCGDYLLPEAALGNRRTAVPTSVRLSWQFLQWYSEDAIRKDLLPRAREMAQKLAKLQSDPLKIARTMIEALRDSDELVMSTDELATFETTDTTWIKLLENDKFGHLTHSALFADKAIEFVREQWCDLALRGGFRFKSGMAVPIPGLPKGCICAPYLPEGDTVITRYPIVSSDNIRVARNVHLEEWTEVGICGIRPEDASLFQGDFDGDEMIMAPASALPNIAKETLRITEPCRFKPIVKFPKQSYLKAQDEQGNALYPTLAHVAVETNMGRMALVAWWIGHIQDSMPYEGEDAKTFKVNKQALLENLFQAMQVEVDHPKNPMKFEHISGLGNLGDQVKDWILDHPSPFFEVHKDPKLYKEFSLPSDFDGSLYVLPNAINELWEPSRLRMPSRESVRYLAEQFPKSMFDLEGAERTQWARGLRDEFNESLKQIREKYGTSDKFKQEVGKLYQLLREQFNDQFTEPEERLQRAAALWDMCHTDDGRAALARQCRDIADKMRPTMLVRQEPLPGQIKEETRYVIAVPAGDPNARDEHGNLADSATGCKIALENSGINYYARLHEKLPVIEFILDVPCPYIDDIYGESQNDWNNVTSPSTREAALKLESNPTIQSMISKFAGAEQCPEGWPDKIPHRIVIHNDYAWVHNPHQRSAGKAALAYNLLPDEVANLLQGYRYNEATVVGVQYNDYQKANLKGFIDQGVVGLKVGRLDLDKNDPKYHRYQGTPCIQSAASGKVLGMFASNGPKLPIGATFEARIKQCSKGTDGLNKSLHIEIVHSSIKVPVPLTDKEEQKLKEQEQQKRRRLKRKKQKGDESPHR